ncbi:MAG TPA: hypothetical protein VFI46_07950 [Jiangellaceae bacterium]|nr:hypothetical protein [Jiangellaceae bacterium]
MEANYRAQVSMPAGVDETRLLVVDEHGERAAETTWRPADMYRPGPATWDWRLNVLGFARVEPWQPDELGFRADVKRIFRDDDR